MEQEAFFLVWNPKTAHARYRHGSESQALDEARRLAAANPNDEFYVLEAVSVSKSNQVVTEKLVNIPF